MHWYFGFFLISGFCSLVYEVVWLRLSMAEFGVTTPMVSIVLSMFMAGLGLGSWGGGRLVRKLEDRAASTALRLYALTELLIGVSALLVAHELKLGHTLLLGIGTAATWQSPAYYGLSGVSIAVTLIPWCACMGATFPLLMSVIRQTQGARSNRSFSYLYVANVLGAVLGTTLSAFLLIELRGFQATLHITSALNVVVAIFAIAISFDPVLSRPSIQFIAEPRTPRRFYGLPETSALWMLFTTGLVSMGMEVIWIRQFTPYLGNVVYAFAVILAVYLVATFHGSRRYRAWFPSSGLGESASKWTTLGLLALIPLAAADPVVPPARGHIGFAIGALRVALGIAPFCASIGFLSPMLVDHWSSGDPDRAGRAYAVNVLGCIVGPLLAGFWLLPLRGEHWALSALALPLFGLGALVAKGRQADQAGSRAAPRRSRLDAKLGYGLLALPALLIVTTTRDYEARFPERVSRRDYAATVVATGKGLSKQLLVNGVGMTNLSPCTKFMAHLPLVFLCGRPRNGLVVCFGMGTTFRSMLSWGIRATAVDLVPSVPALFGYFHPDAQQFLSSPLAHVVVDDGRRFLDGSMEHYDVITVDPPPPSAAPTSSLLYSREFYRIAKKHLRPGGILQVWYPLNDPDAGACASVVKALKQSFPYVRAFQSLEGSGLHFLASMESLPPTSGSVLAARLPRSAAIDLVEWGPASNAEEQLESILVRERSVEELIAEDPNVPALEDDQPINEYYFLRRTFHYYR
jgi:predicted membrane-bound spermidine synthase